jgi:hypothetical protein
MPKSVTIGKLLDGFFLVFTPVFLLLRMIVVRNTYTNDLTIVGDLCNMTYDIVSNRKTMRYVISGIDKENRNDQEERRTLLIEIVKKNPRILHTHVIKIAQDLGNMAKRTIEKELSRLEEDWFLESTKLSDSPNGMRIWEVHSLDVPLSKEDKIRLDKHLESLNISVEQFGKFYSRALLEERSELASLLLISLNDAQPLFMIGGKTMESERRQHEFQKLLDGAYDVLFRDNEFPKIKPLIVKRLLDEAISSDKKYGKFIWATYGNKSKKSKK